MQASELNVSAERQDDPVTAVERAYWLILGRRADPEGAAGYLRALRSGELSVADVCASLASSAEFAQRLAPPVDTSARAEEGGPGTGDPDWIDVTDFLENTSVQELAERAEGYFRALDDPTELLAKPLNGMRETSDLLVAFGQVLRGLRPLPGMTVLDFGAGSCWTSRFLTQLGCRVKAFDVSPTALSLGRRLYAELPVVGDQPEPEFRVFDGHRFDLADASVDRILCFDALHHVPNPDEVIREMARVLRPGGIAAFSEPGDRHSRQAQSQYEMRNYGVLENDVVIEDVWKWAQEAGFVDLRLCLFDSVPQWVDIDSFDDVISGRDTNTFLEPTSVRIADRRMFCLRRDGVEVPDSREVDGLVGDLTIEELSFDDTESPPVVTGVCRAHNPGPRTWLPSDAEFGPVLLGARLHLGDRTVRDLARIPIPGPGVGPAETASFPVHVEIPPHPEGVVAVEFDLVSEHVCWFSVNGSAVVRFPLTLSA